MYKYNSNTTHTHKWYHQLSLLKNDLLYYFQVHLKYGLLNLKQQIFFYKEHDANIPL